MTIPLRLIQPGQTSADVKPLVEAWIGNLIAHDESRGRAQQDFTTKGMSEVVSEVSQDMRARGFDTHQGGGNIFFVTYKNGQPLVVHARPLAQRVVRPRFV